MTVVQMPRKDQTPEKSGNSRKVPASAAEGNSAAGRVSQAQLRYLRLGLGQPGGKLPLFDQGGQEIKPATIKSCIEKGLAEPWFSNPVKPGWLVCRLTEEGRKAAERGLS
ncbi:hypothetical protein [Salaquimonas pukyongi]|uniref:hypothetical protein n=1 Tax=Salaquimonas pukyongi TaxID=2712698 RepID=UPI001967C163|nr:hypothetical protein [Salaquimonas pukyongi]